MSKGYHDYFRSFSKSSVNRTGRYAYYTSQGTELSEPLLRLSYQELKIKFKKLLKQKIHGLAFSPYVEDQGPGVKIASAQIKSRLGVINPFIRWVRTFSCTQGNQKIPQIARDMGIRTMVGVNIGENHEENIIELQNGISLAKLGYADILAVGNEVLLRGDITEEKLLKYIREAKQKVPGQIVAYVDAYFLFENHPRVAEECDVLLINCYPFWEGTEAKYAIHHMQDMYRRAINVANGKPVIISETGWPTVGTAFGSAVPSIENALGYLVSAYSWAQEAGIDLIYFSAFDEAWKRKDEGDVGAYWGIWDQYGQCKYK